MLKEYFSDKRSAKEALEEVQKLTFYPMMFQAARILRNSGILEAVYTNKRKGITAKAIAKELGQSFYMVNTLLETGLTVGLVFYKKEDLFSLTKMGYHLLFNEATRVNLNFTHDVCYKALFHLEDAFTKDKPAGLHEIGLHDKTIYPGLSRLNETVKSSWFEFDHYYSDNAFPDALALIFSGTSKPKKMIDIGGNTGKWSLKCCAYDPEVSMVILDLPGQWEKAQEHIAASEFSDRISGVEGDVLEPSLHLPKDIDAVWMSQFLDCFSYDQIVHILQNIHKNIRSNTSVFIQELFWDRQKDLAAAYALHGTSLYFTAVANGNSKMYHSKEFIQAINEAGFDVVKDVDEIGEFHTILECKPKAT